ncbi:YwmB family TATA-box binding protein [Shouchella shacheensis]|uniref:YwmB family TATA-box binding protein n=1 Tax=Shouchella shacheensis TaxID=1649580 RepID=UPI000740289A|nr:YwmB family TATA-box binding protein [Shouchella shacheensis]
MKVMLKASVFAVMVILLGAVYVSSEEKTQADLLNDQMESIHTLLAQEEVALDQFQLRARAESGTVKTQKAFHDHVHTLEATHPEFQAETVDTQGTEWTALLRVDEGEALKVMAQETSGPSALTYSYERSGEAGDDSFEELQETLTRRLNQFEMEDVQLFYQISAKKTDSLDAPLYDEAKRYLDELGAAEQEALKEETFVSLSAYNGEWNENLVTGEGKKMNVQVAVRQDPEMGSKATVTIGTPIITTEY